MPSSIQSLLIVNAKARAPLRADTAELLFDGQPAQCERQFEQYALGWECEVNGDIEPVEFRNDDSESPSYRVEVLLLEKSCSGREEICDA